MHACMHTGAAESKTEENTNSFSKEIVNTQYSTALVLHKFREPFKIREPLKTPGL